MRHAVFRTCEILLWLMLFISSCGWANTTLFAALHDYPPFVISNSSVSSDSHFEGIDWEVLQELSARTGIDIIPLRYPYSRGLVALQEGQVDMMTSMTLDQDLPDSIEFLGTPYYQCQMRFYALPEQAIQIRNYTDLIGKKIGLVRGKHYFHAFDTDERLLKDPVNQVTQLPLKLTRQFNQVSIGSDCQMEYMLQQMQLTGQIVPTLYQPQQAFNLYIGYNRHALQPQEIDRLNRALADMVKAGWINQVARGYFHPGH